MELKNKTEHREISIPEIHEMQDQVKAILDRFYQLTATEKIPYLQQKYFNTCHAAQELQLRLIKLESDIIELAAAQEKLNLKAG